METIEINGKLYRERPEPPKKRISPRMATILAVAEMMGNMDPYGEKRKVSTIPIDTSLAHEYELIMNKKSKLSASQRQAVVHRFHQVFEEVKQ
jgi:hypothetical protein